MMNDEEREALRFVLASIIVLGPLVLGLALYAMSGTEWALCGGVAWICIVFVWAISTFGDE